MNKSFLSRVMVSSVLVACVLLTLGFVWLAFSGGVMVAAATDGWATSTTSAPADSAAPQVVPVGNNGATAVTSLIYNGSFEEISQPGWYEYLSTITCGLTKIGDWSANFGFPAYDGLNTLWVGGYCGEIPFSNYAEQWLSISHYEPILSFWYYAERIDPDSSVPDDFAYVDLIREERQITDVTRLWELPMIHANNTDGWVNVQVDLSQFVGGSSVLLRFGNSVGTQDSLVGNVLFDYVSLESLPPIVANIDPENGGALIYTDPQGSRTIIEAPPRAVTSTVALLYAPRDPEFFPLPGDYANHAFDLDVNAHLAYLPLLVGAANTSLGTPSPAAKPLGSLPYEPSFTFLQPLTVTIEYSDNDVLFIDEETLRVYYWSGTEWVDAIQTCIDAGILPEPFYTSNPDENYVQLPVCHLSRFGMVGN